MNRGISVALLAVLFYGTLLWIAVVSSGTRIEQDLKQRAVGALKEIENLPSALDLRFEGRDVVVAGEVHGQGQAQRVIAALRAVEDIRGLEDKLSVRPPEPSSLLIRQVKDGWALEGRLSSSEEVAGLEQALSRALNPGKKLQGGIRTEVHTRPSVWLSHWESGSGSIWPWFQEMGALRYSIISCRFPGMYSQSSGRRISLQALDPIFQEADWSSLTRSLSSGHRILRS